MNPPCIAPGCDNPKKPGQGQHYCSPCQKVTTERRQLADRQRLKEWCAANPDRAKAANAKNQATQKYRANRSIAKKRRRLNDPRRAWSDTLWERFRITADQYEAILAAQGGGCKLCGRPQGSQQRRLHVDHDHRCCPTIGKCCGQCIRGLLCAGCNQLLGWYERRRPQIEAYVNQTLEQSA